MTEETKPRNWQTIKEYTDILFDFYDGIARISINRPEVYNAFRPQTNREILDALDSPVTVPKSVWWYSLV